MEVYGIRLETHIPIVFGSDRSPRRGDVVRPFVRLSGIFCKIAVRMSYRSILKSPGGGSRAGRQVSRQAGRHTSRQASRQASS